MSHALASATAKSEPVTTIKSCAFADFTSASSPISTESKTLRALDIDSKSCLVRLLSTVLGAKKMFSVIALSNGISFAGSRELTQEYRTRVRRPLNLSSFFMASAKAVNA